ncbi:hypothetical protein GCM10010156_69640 [Planobispora rosea]|uniref:DUF7824 domain-containing protein n=1 Tax=Planobispora rosea TaxID=35762 RepID=A0A8J3SAZ6_PLARO|nr:DUF6493 family protein [Planobispora rosea]GGT01775.1 hypothetical protein GCM10010156_69640 [Planobispora rosea]GIH88389.1 hypothetical protein Pro02_67970 [Planobispora rosea]
MLERIKEGDAEGTAGLLEVAADADRYALAAPLRIYFWKAMARNAWWGRERPEHEQAPALRAALAVCLDDAREVARWLTKPELWLWTGHRRDADRLARLLRGRPAQWRSQVVSRLAEQAPWDDGDESRGRAMWWSAWYPAAALLEDPDIEPPGSETFVIGWMRAVAEAGHRVTGERLARDLLRVLLRLRGPSARLRPKAEVIQAWAAVMAGLADEDVIERRELAEGCAAAFFDGESWPFTDLFAALRPEPEDLPVRDLVRSLSVASGPAAGLAVVRLRRADDAGLLTDELFSDAVGALAFRPEKKCVRAAFSWIETAVRREPRRADDALAAVAAVFGIGPRDLQERAVRLALKLAGRAGEPGRQAVRAAADELPGDLRERLGTAFRLPGAPERTPPALPAFTAGTRPLAAVESVDELVGLVTAARGQMEIERLVGGLVTLVHRDREAVRAAVEPVLRGHWPSLFDGSAAYGFGGMDDPHLLAARAALAAVAPQVSGELRGRLPSYPARGPMPDVLTVLRLREAVVALESAAVPVLLATPTASTGHVDPDTLVARMERLEAAGTPPLAADFQQALVRLPREIDPAAAVRARRLSTSDGRALADWLARGGLADPDVGHRVERLPLYEGSPEIVTRILPAVWPREEDLPVLVRRLCMLNPAYAVSTASQMTEWWPAIMPSHREVITAWMLPRLPALAGSRGADLLPLVRLARGQGPAGVVSAAALAHGLGFRDDRARGTAVDALLIHAARGDLAGQELGRFLADLVTGEVIKLGPVVAALGDAVAAGAHAAVWEAVCGMLRGGILPRPQDRPRTGLAGLLAVGVTAAALTGARADIPELVETTARGGSSRLVQETRRLQGVIGSGDAAR